MAGIALVSTPTVDPSVGGSVSYGRGRLPSFPDLALGVAAPAVFVILLLFCKVPGVITNYITGCIYLFGIIATVGTEALNFDLIVLYFESLTF